MQLRESCCADSVQVGEGKVLCKICSSSAQLFQESAQFCGWQSCGAPAVPVPALVCPEVVLAGIVPSAQELSHLAREGTQVALGVKKAKCHNKRCPVGDTAVSMWPWLVPSLEVAAGPSLALAPVI